MDIVEDILEREYLHVGVGCCTGLVPRGQMEGDRLVVEAEGLSADTPEVEAGNHCKPSCALVVVVGKTETKEKSNCVLFTVKRHFYSTILSRFSVSLINAFTRRISA